MVLKRRVLFILLKSSIFFQHFDVIENTQETVDSLFVFMKEMMCDTTIKCDWSKHCSFGHAEF